MAFGPNFQKDEYRRLRKDKQLTGISPVQAYRSNKDEKKFGHSIKSLRLSIFTFKIKVLENSPQKVKDLSVMA